VKVPLLVHIMSVTEAAPLVVAALARRSIGGPRLWVLVWAAVQVCESAVQFALAAHGVRNLWVPYVFEPIGGAAVLWALAQWQDGPMARLALRLSVPAVLVTFALLTVLFDSTSDFSRAAWPMLQLVCLAAAAYTLVARSRIATGDLLRLDWFWICGGMVLFFGTFGILEPLSRALVRQDLTLFIRVYEVESLLATVAFLAIAWGIACPAAA
jgi:hypothetical protein